METATMIAFLLLAATSGLLVWHAKYEDGLFGRIALGLQWFCALIAATMLWFGEMPTIHPVLHVHIWCITLFFLRHAYKWARFNLFGDHNWQRVRGGTDEARRLPQA